MPAATLLGLHHATATVDGAQDDLDFAAGALALRLVKRTVNFDNHHVFHFYYGNATGSPGSIWTTFPYRGRGVRVGTHGAGQITATAFAVPRGSMAFWRDRLSRRGVAVDARPDRFGDPVLATTDPSGLAMEIVGTTGDSRIPWAGSGVAERDAIRGLHGVTLTIGSPPRTIAFMTDVLGFAMAGQDGERTRLTAGAASPGHFVDVVEAAGDARGVNGLGTVHHVAMAVATSSDQIAIRHELVRLGVAVTEVLDRQYFQSIYFREPGGVLFEVATVQPGFLVDEPEAALGQTLKLPPWEEPHRAAIEAGLPAITLRP